MANEIALHQLIQHGDRVTIVDRFGKLRTGTAVLKAPIDGWVLNMGGPHGTPKLADESNVVKVARGRQILYTV